MNPMLMTPRLSSSHTGDQPLADWCTCAQAAQQVCVRKGGVLRELVAATLSSHHAPHAKQTAGSAPLPLTVCPSSPSIRGMEGPQMSTSSSPTERPCAASVNASCAENVDLPTPPLPDSTSTLCFTDASLSAISSTAAAARAQQRMREGDEVSGRHASAR
jgi:hypothetical protein